MSNLAYDVSILRREFGEKSLLVFSKTYFKKYFTCNEAKFHRELYKLLEDITPQRNKRLAIAAPRGSAKSSIITAFYVIWCLCYGKEDYIVLFSDTSSQAKDLLSHIKNELTANELLMQDFPEICEAGNNPRPPRWKKDEIITKNNIKITAFGANQKIRGRRHKENRPSLIILDDIENDENTQSQEQRQKLFDWFTRAVLKAGSIKTNIVFVGTIQHYDSLLAKLTDPNQMPEWDKKIYKSVISWSKATLTWQSWVNRYFGRKICRGKIGPEAAREYFEENKEAMLAGTEVLWPEKEDYYTLMQIRESEGIYSFNAEKQNEPSNPRDMIFNPEEFCYWDTKYDSEEQLIGTSNDFDMYGACDPSLGRTSTSDFSAIVTLARHKETGNVYVLDADISRRKPDKIIEDILVFCKKRRYRKFIVEANQFQSYLASELQKRINKEGIGVPIEPVMHSSDKVSRIQSLQPFAANSTIRFSKRHHTLIEQLRHFPKGANDDGPDALEMAFSCCKNSNHEYAYYFWTF
jgi:predicted phage terminase large subunit-like protein